MKVKSKVRRAGQSIYLLLPSPVIPDNINLDINGEAVIHIIDGRTIRVEFSEEKESKGGPLVK